MPTETTQKFLSEQAKNHVHVAGTTTEVEPPT